MKHREQVVDLAIAIAVEALQFYAEQVYSPSKGNNLDPAVQWVAEDALTDIDNLLSLRVLSAEKKVV